MWVGKFKIHHNCPILKRTKKYDVISTGYVLNIYEENGEKYHSMLHVVRGKEKKKFIESFKKDKKVTKLEINGDFFYAIIKGEMIAQRYSKKLFYLEPVVHQKNHEIWFLGSENRKELLKFYERVKEIGQIEILQLQNIKPPMLVQTVIPKLTEKQHDALDKAMSFGYYDNPRKISIKEIAEKLKRPRATFQEHLRKAEGKVMRNVISMFLKKDKVEIKK